MHLSSSSTRKRFNQVFQMWTRRTITGLRFDTGGEHGLGSLADPFKVRVPLQSGMNVFPTRDRLLLEVRPWLSSPLSVTSPTHRP
jgi:hypothetical protein